MHLVLSAEDGYLVSPSKRVFDDLADVERLRPAPLHSGWEDEDRTGWEMFLHRLKRSPTTATIPILICTAALDQVQEYEQVLRDQGIPFLSKPFALDELLAQVRQLLA